VCIITILLESSSSSRKIAVDKNGRHVEMSPFIAKNACHTCIYREDAALARSFHFLITSRTFMTCMQISIARGKTIEWNVEIHI
jgi:hypothetical protein